MAFNGNPSQSYGASPATQRSSSGDAELHLRSKNVKKKEKKS